MESRVSVELSRLRGVVEEVEGIESTLETTRKVLKSSNSSAHELQEAIKIFYQLQGRVEIAKDLVTQLAPSLLVTDLEVRLNNCGGIIQSQNGAFRKARNSIDFTIVDQARTAEGFLVLLQNAVLYHIGTTKPCWGGEKITMDNKKIKVATGLAQMYQVMQEENSLQKIIAIAKERCALSSKPGLSRYRFFCYSVRDPKLEEFYQFVAALNPGQPLNAEQVNVFARYKLSVSSLTRYQHS